MVLFRRVFASLCKKELFRPSLKIFNYKNVRTLATCGPSVRGRNFMWISSFSVLSYSVVFLNNKKEEAKLCENFFLTL